MHVPQGPSAEEIRQQRKRMMAQEEIQDSSAGLLKNVMSTATSDDNHSKRFKRAIRPRCPSCWRTTWAG